MSDKLLLDWMPEQASSWASRVDFINNFITYVAAFCTVVITGVMLYFAWKYRRRPGNESTSYITHNSTLETIWTAIPTLVCIFVGYYGIIVYHEMRTPPADPLEIQVSARKWAWSYVYPNGKTADNDLVVPVNKPVRLIMTSQDVNHSFFLPAMRVKEDVINGTYHYLWFTPIKTGESHIFCAEYCGLGHSAMLGKLRVVTEAEYQDYINDRSAVELPPDELGKKLYDAKGCKQCHSLDGAAGLGPTFKGVFGRQEHFEDGSSLTVDEAYIHESLVTPAAKVVKGFQPVMPPFNTLKEEEIAALVAFLKTVK